MRGRSPRRPLLAVPNVTAHPSTASVPITVLFYNVPLFCSFNVPIKSSTNCCQSLTPPIQCPVGHDGSARRSTAFYGQPS